ncbi:hypothetical protein RRF57_009485 [Xylaria bambusicola]|uniref:Uncharacterized protein n=1 Tax=Xylaria bambusicola TaxID=326684 RepID=A0AAN7Z904_9PEZI
MNLKDTWMKREETGELTFILPQVEELGGVLSSSPIRLGPASNFVPVERVSLYPILHLLLKRQFKHILRHGGHLVRTLSDDVAGGTSRQLEIEEATALAYLEDAVCLGGVTVRQDLGERDCF